MLHSTATHCDKHGGYHRKWVLPNSMTELSPCAILFSDLLEVPHPASYGQWIYNVQQFMCAGDAGLSLHRVKTLSSSVCQWYR